MDFKKILFRTNTIDVEKALPDAIIMCSKDGKILWVNDVASEIFNTSKIHLLTSKIEDFIENPMIMITNSILQHKAVIVKLSGSEIYFDMTAKEIEEGFVLDLRDISSINQNNIQESFDEINRDKNNFLLKLANDFKSPIQSIVGFSQAMADGLGGKLNEQQEKYIRIINKNSSELMYFIDKLMELSKTETINDTLECKPFDIVGLVNMVVRYNEQLFKGKDIKLIVNQEENFKKTVTSNEDAIKTILQDILEVVLKAVDMGEIAINLSNPSEEFITAKNLPPRTYTMISVSSSALLLSENDLECMFDPYKIVDIANRKNVLRAIVLASVKNIVQTLNGVLWVESQILKNTSFNILF